MAEYGITRPTADVVRTEFREILRSATGSMKMHGRMTAYEKNTFIAFDVTGTGIRGRTLWTQRLMEHGSMLMPTSTSEDDCRG